MSKPLFIIKEKLQKGGSYKDLLGREILSRISHDITGNADCRVKWDSVGYNKGRMAILEYNGKRNYISFSEMDAKQGRNYFFQSVPTALNQCIINGGKNARPYYYFLPVVGNFESSYYRFMYRLLNTVGVKFLNPECLSNPIKPFLTVEDLIRARDENRGRNHSNNSTYMTLDGDAVQIFAKVYGANKYESEMFALASQRITNGKIELFQIKEGDLTELPTISQQVLSRVCGNQLRLVVSDMSLEKEEFEKGDSLRSPRFIYNLLDRLGQRKCALCACDIPEVIQGAHIWGVSQIKRDNSLSADEKLAHAISQHNGLWLCENHHKMFDTDIIRIGSDGTVAIRNRLTSEQKEFVRNITPDMRVPENMMSEELVHYLLRRYAA